MLLGMRLPHLWRVKEGILLAFENLGTEVACSGGGYCPTGDIDSVIRFLGQPHSGFKVSWDLDALIEPLGIKEGKSRTPAEHMIIYNPGKSIFIGLKHGASTSIYNLGQFYPDDLSEPLTLKHVVYKGEELLDEMREIGIRPNKLSSPIAMFDDIFDRLDLPTWEDTENVDPDINQAATECLNRIWNTAYKIGYFHETFDYDQNAAYPAIVAGLRDTRNGRWYRCNRPPPPAVYGFARGKLLISKEMTPFVHLSASGDGFDAVGERYTTITLGQYAYLKEYGCGNMVIDHGYWWVPKNGQSFPLDIIIKQYFRERAGASPLLNRILKRAINGFYGMLRQVYMPECKYGKRTNLVWAAVVETESALNVGRFIYDNDLENDVIQVATDGVLSSKKADIESSADIGKWRLDSTGPALVLDTGLAWHGNKHPNQLYLEDAVKLIEAKPTMREWHRGTIGLRMPLAQEHDRKFEKLPANGGELLNGQYDSQSFNVTELK